MPTQLRDLVEGLALRRPPPRIAEVHRAVCAVATALGWPAPSYEVVRRIVHRLDPGLVALAHHDPDVYRESFELVLPRESVAANDLWQADDDRVDFGQLDAVASAEPVR